MTEPDDPVLADRARIARLAERGQRAGYLLYGMAMVVFFVGFATGFSTVLARVIVIALVAGSALLAPAIIAGYAVKAADRADRDDEW
ncbi:MAG: hypothetical protein ACE5GB_10040 [Acidimicrobiales bacterium]